MKWSTGGGKDGDLNQCISLTLQRYYLLFVLLANSPSARINSRPPLQQNKPRNSNNDGRDPDDIWRSPWRAFFVPDIKGGNDGKKAAAAAAASESTSSYSSPLLRYFRRDRIDLFADLEKVTHLSGDEEVRGLFSLSSLGVNRFPRVGMARNLI